MKKIYNTFTKNKPGLSQYDSKILFYYFPFSDEANELFYKKEILLILYLRTDYIREKKVPQQVFETWTPTV